jgi:myo-inositol-1(or 4)-monophosphatase
MPLLKDKKYYSILAEMRPECKGESKSGNCYNLRMAELDLKKVLEFTEQLILKEGDYLMRNWHDAGKLDFHDAIDFSTKHDCDIEERYFQALKKEFPAHAFWGEEDASKRDTNNDYIWYADPIDGTKYFARTVPMFTTLLALTYKAEPVVGVVYDPVSKQLFSAAKGLGTKLNGKEIKVNDQRPLKDQIMSLEIGEEDTDWEDKKLLELKKRCGRIRIMGNASLSICWSVLGSLGGYVDLFGMADHDKKQDLQAPFLIASEAGMVVEEFKLGNKTKCICVLPHLAEELKQIILD